METNTNIQIDPEFLQEIKQQSEKEKTVIDRSFKGRSLGEIAGILNDTNSEIHGVLYSKAEIPSYEKIIQELDHEIRLKGMVTASAEELLARLPRDNELRFAVEEAVAREILKIGFGHLKNLEQVKTVLAQLKKYLHAEDALVGSDNVPVDVTQYMDLLSVFGEQLKQKKSIKHSLVMTITNNYGLRDVITEIIGKENIDNQN